MGLSWLFMIRVLEKSSPVLPRKTRRLVLSSCQRAAVGGSVASPLQAAVCDLACSYPFLRPYRMRNGGSHQTVRKEQDQPTAAL